MIKNDIIIIKELEIYHIDTIGSLVTIVIYEIEKNIFYIKSPFSKDDMEGTPYYEWDDRIISWIFRNPKLSKNIKNITNFEHEFEYLDYFSKDELSRLKSDIREYRFSKILD